LCDYAVKLTLTPGDMSKADVVKLNDAGFSDQQVTVAVQVVGYFNYINRVADGLGVEPESWMTIDHNFWIVRKGHDYLRL